MYQTKTTRNPAAGTVNKVLIITRISTEHQDERSLADQNAFCQNWALKNLEGPCEFIHVSSRGSGENLERPELQKFEGMITSGEITHIICEESSRLCRRYYTIAFCELCEDHGVRFIAINDNVDTATDWRVNTMFSSVKHEMSNKDTSNRIRRTQRNRFINGGVVQYENFGYVKPTGAKHDSELHKDPNLIPFVEGIFQRIEEGANYCEVAAWLNQESVPVGKHSRTKGWDNNKVRRIVTNPIYKGTRERNRKTTKRVNSSGRHKSVDAAPEELLTRECPHLRYIDPERFDRINALLKQKNDKYRRGRLAAKDNRKGVPRKRTAWPGQHAKCGICQSLFYWGGHGQKLRMMCSVRRNYRCWNSATCDGPQLAKRLVLQALQTIEELPDFPAAFRDQIMEEVKTRKQQSQSVMQKLLQEIAALGQKVDNVTGAIAENGCSPSLKQKLSDLEGELASKQTDLADLQHEDVLEIELPSMDELKQLARECLVNADFKDPATHRLLSQMMPIVELHPYMLDEGAMVLRAHAKIRLDAFKEGMPLQLMNGLIEYDMVVDLFEPPQRERYRKEITTLMKTGISKKQIARQLGIAPLVVDRAIKLQSMMDQHGWTDPYRKLSELPNRPRFKAREQYLATTKSA
jgi:site-specific DNA recombinase